jgi:anti-sigma regulatory factor (Ser/Thr protein kinase)
VVALTGWATAPEPASLRWIRVEEPSAAGACRSAALGLAGRLAFPEARAEQLALAVTEAASNLARHARAGSLMLRARPAGDGGGGAVELVTIDAGPGIADLDAAVRDGTSTAGTLGIGLGAIRRAADFCDLYSRPGQGTALAARFLAEPLTTGSLTTGSLTTGPLTTGSLTTGRAAPGPPGTGAQDRWAGLIRPIGGETECGDNYAARQAGEATWGVLCDGLGHGPLAAAASRAALAAIAGAGPGEPAELLEHAHRQMAGTRGGALAVVRAAAGRVTFAGLGNVAGWIVSGEGRQGLISVPGIAGHQARRVRQFDYQAGPGDAIVLHSDGLTSRWDPRELPGLVRRDPLVIAAALLGAAGVHRDDAGVLVLRP